jgi:hypothetical protein
MVQTHRPRLQVSQLCGINASTGQCLDTDARTAHTKHSLRYWRTLSAAACGVYHCTWPIGHICDPDMTYALCALDVTRWSASSDSQGS